MSIERQPELSLSPEEGKNIKRVDPTVLMRDNPAALIVNRESYDRMGAFFAPPQFDPPQVVRVKVFSSSHGEVEKLFVIDGMTRTKYAADHKGQPVPNYPNFHFDSIPVRDVTESTLRNPMIVPEEEKDGNIQAITLLQYLRAVVPPTIEHSKIAVDRIAAHLINSWENAVGSGLATRFSALAAISLLANRTVPIASMGELKKYLAAQHQLVTGKGGESTEDRRVLEKSLIDMASIIRQAKLSVVKNQVAQAAFVLVSTGSEVIGGEREARRQIYGLLHSPDITRKLVIAFPQPMNEVRLENERQLLGKQIMESLAIYSTHPRAEEIINDVLIRALKDPRLSLDQTRTLLQSPDPMKAYDQLRRELNRNRVTQLYTASQRRTVLTPEELQLIDQLGSRTITTEGEDVRVVNTIRAAATVLNQAERLTHQLTSGREQFLNGGVSPRTIEEGLPRIEAIKSELTSAVSPVTLSRKAQELKETIGVIESRIGREIIRNKIIKGVDAVFGERLRDGYGAQVRRSLVEYIERKSDVDLTNDVQISLRLRQLASLDEDIQFQVVEGSLRITRALQLQGERRKPKPQINGTTETSTKMAGPVAAETPKIASLPKTVEIAYMERETVQVQLDRTAIEQRRVAEVNERLIRDLASFENGVLAKIDLDPKDVSKEAHGMIESIIRRLGRLGYSHPNIPRVIEDALARAETERQRLITQVQQDQEASWKDTRTGQ